jgi:hypothetical protein
MKFLEIVRFWKLKTTTIACQSVKSGDLLFVLSLMCCGAHGRWVLLECPLEICF